MATSSLLLSQATELQRAMADLVKKYQFRDRNETVCYGLSVSQAYTLRALHERGPLSMGALAQAMHLSVSTLTRVVDQLVKKSLVARVRPDADRRVCRVDLTDAGRELWLRIESELVGSNVDVIESIRPEERETVIRVMGLLSRAVDAWRAEKANGSQSS